MTTMEVEPLLDAKAVAAWLNVPVSWVYSAARDGRLPSVNAGRWVRFDREAIRQWIADGGAAGEEG